VIWELIEDEDLIEKVIAFVMIQKMSEMLCNIRVFIIGGRKPPMRMSKINGAKQHDD
jgi:hypothetical protein